MLTRRQLLRIGAALGVGMFVPVPAPSSVRRTSARAPVRQSAPFDWAPLLEKYVDPVPLPQPLAPNGKYLESTYYEIAMRQSVQTLHRDLPPTTIWGYNGQYPGPTIEARRNERIAIKWMNELGTEDHMLDVDPTLHGPNLFTNPLARRAVVHLHGGHVPPESDGYPNWMLEPGQSQIYFYPNRQPAETLWYHDHGLGITRLNVAMGLAGFWLLREDYENNLKLPSGKYEIPIVIQDRTFDEFGQIYYPYPWQEEFFGDIGLVNGKVWPYLEVERRRYRFRFLNGSNARSYIIYLSDEPNDEDIYTPKGQVTFHQIGTDGGLLPQRVDSTALTIAPGERADVVIDFSTVASDTLYLNNAADAPFRLMGDEPAIPELMKIKLLPAVGKDKSKLPIVVRPIDPPPVQKAVRTRDFFLDVAAGHHMEMPMGEEMPPTMMMAILSLAEGWTADNWGHPMPPDADDMVFYHYSDYVIGQIWDDITEQVELGSYEIWRFFNLTPDMHPMHMHLGAFRLLDRQNLVPDPMRDDFFRPEIEPGSLPVLPEANEVGFKDTIKAYAGTVTRILMRFTDFTGKYPYHCHIIDHEDHEMMRQFEVVPPAVK